VGEAMSLTETQGRMVPGLEVGHAIVHTEEQDKPVWVKMEDVKAARGPVSDAEVSERMRPLRTERAAADLSHASELARRLAARSRRLGERLAERQVS
jgi:hypothetical protein